MIEVKIDNRNVIEAMERLARATANPRPALLAIGESLVTSTKKRFQTSTAPDGSKWKPNADSTLRSGLHRGGHFKKNGSLKKAGQRYIAGKKPLIGRTHFLSGSIKYSLEGNILCIGSPAKYAAMQQFGGEKSQFPKLWGDIPARPFLGISESDATVVLKTVNNYLRSVIE